MLYVHIGHFTGVTYRSLVEAFHPLQMYGDRETRAVNNVAWILRTEELLGSRVQACLKVHVVTRERGGEI